MSSQSPPGLVTCRMVVLTVDWGTSWQSQELYRVCMTTVRVAVEGSYLGNKSFLLVTGILHVYVFILCFLCQFIQVVCIESFIWSLSSYDVVMYWVHDIVPDKPWACKVSLMVQLCTVCIETKQTSISVQWTCNPDVQTRLGLVGGNYAYQLHLNPWFKHCMHHHGYLWMTFTYEQHQQWFT